MSRLGPRAGRHRCSWCRQHCATGRPAEIRRFVRGLTGADQELYDYLAEEVVGDLPEDLQRFLMRTSILQAVSADLAGVVADLDEVDVGRLTAAAERLTLLSRPPRVVERPARYHPLVREFLEARLRASIGSAAVAELHHRVAEAAADLDWRIAAYHYREAGDPAAVAAAISSAPFPKSWAAAAYAAASRRSTGSPRKRPTAGPEPRCIPDPVCSSATTNRPLRSRMQSWISVRPGSQRERLRTPESRHSVHLQAGDGRQASLACWAA